MKAAAIPHSVYLIAQGNIVLRPENLEWVNLCVRIYKYMIFDRLLFPFYA